MEKVECNEMRVKDVFVCGRRTWVCGKTRPDWSKAGLSCRANQEENECSNQGRLCYGPEVYQYATRVKCTGLVLTCTPVIITCEVLTGPNQEQYLTEYTKSATKSYLVGGS